MALQDEDELRQIHAAHICLWLDWKKFDDETMAEQIAELFGNDGFCWRLPDGLELRQVLDAAGSEEEDDEIPNVRRFEFEDGSAIVATNVKWGVEGETPFSFLDGSGEC